MKYGNKFVYSFKKQKMACNSKRNCYQKKKNNNVKGNIKLRTCEKHIGNTGITNIS